MQSFRMIFSGVTILQGVEFPIFLLIFAWASSDCCLNVTQMLFVRWKARQRTSGDIDRQELRQVRHSGARARSRDRILARTHATRQGRLRAYPLRTYHARYNVLRNQSRTVTIAGLMLILLPTIILTCLVKLGRWCRLLDPWLSRHLCCRNGPASGRSLPIII